MKRLVSSSALCLSLLAAFAACRGSGNGDDDGTDIDAASGEQTVFDVQNDATPPGTPVTLRGVVVTAIDNYGPRKGNFYVAEPEGGAFSGVLVYNAPLDQVAALVVGDLVDITGAEKDEFSLETDDSTVTELGPVAGGTMTVTKVGTGTVPAPQVLDALAIGQMATAAREAEYEKWEGVLVRVENISVTSEIRPVSGSMPDPTFVAFSITGVLEIDSSLAEIPFSTDVPPPPPWLTGGDCLASITGMGDYFFNYKVLPRATADIVMGGTSCPAAEAPGTCTDGIDNDANGFMDCADRGCRNEPTCTTDTTVAMIRTGGVTGGVRLNDVVVVGRDIYSSMSQGIWVADAATAATNTGIYVFTGSTAPDPAWTVGSLVDVMGTATQFDMQLMQIQSATITTATGGGTVPTPITGVAAGTLADVTAGEPYEGSLVRLSNAMVTNNALGNDKVELTVGGQTIIVDDFAFDYAAATAFPSNTTISCITGVMHWNHFDDHRILVPRDTDDIVPSAGCP